MASIACPTAFKLFMMAQLAARQGNRAVVRPLSPFISTCTHRTCAVVAFVVTDRQKTVQRKQGQPAVGANLALRVPCTRVLFGILYPLCCLGPFPEQMDPISIFVLGSISFCTISYMLNKYFPVASTNSNMREESVIGLFTIDIVTDKLTTSVHWSAVTGAVFANRIEELHLKMIGSLATEPHQDL